MNARRLAPPLLMALAVSSLCTLALSRKLSVQAAPHRQSLHYVAPSRALEAGEVIHPESLQVIEWPAESPVSGAFSRADDLLGRAVLYPVGPNQPLTDKLVSAPGAGVGLAGRIPNGMRAIALRSDEVMGVAGFLLPGSHLDVLVTYRMDRSPDPRTVTVLQNAEVIAAGHQVQPDPQGKPATVDVVTLLLNPADAERAVLASTQGTIHFVLRSGSDQSRTKDDGIDLAGLSGAPSPLAPNPLPHVAALHPSTPRPAPAATPKPVHQAVVQTISGDKQVTATFDEGGR